MNYIVQLQQVFALFCTMYSAVEVGLIFMASSIAQLKTLSPVQTNEETEVANLNDTDKVERKENQQEIKFCTKVWTGFSPGRVNLNMHGQCCNFV
jgi:hypothetical protein